MGDLDDEKQQLNLVVVVEEEKHVEGFKGRKEEHASVGFSSRSGALHSPMRGILPVCSELLWSTQLSYTARSLCAFSGLVESPCICSQGVKKPQTKNKPKTKPKHQCR